MNTHQFIGSFEQVVISMLGLVKKKNADYGWQQHDAFANFRNVEKLGICSVEQGLLTRITDKVSRINTLCAADQQVYDEKITDTLIDLANYAIILKLYIESKNAKNAV